MKQNEISSLTTLGDYELENIFNLYVNDDGQYFYNIFDTITFPEDLDPSIYTTHTVGPGEHWNTISHKYYGTIKLWWLVLAANQINNAVIMPPVGMGLKIIVPSVVPSILAQLKK